MKKKQNSYIGLGILVGILFLWIIGSTFPSYAQTKGTVYLTSDRNLVEKGEQVVITVQLKDNQTAAYSTELFFDDTKLEYVSGPENTNVIGNRIIHVWHDPSGGQAPKKGEIGTYTFRSKENGLANLSVQGELYSQARSVDSN